jgi:hypothetical protein
MKQSRLYILIILAAVAGFYLFFERTGKKGGATSEADFSSKSGSAQSALLTAKNPMLSNTNLSEYARSIIENWAEMPDLTKIGQLTPEEKRILVEAYRREPVLVKRRSLTFALGFGEVEKAVELFKHTLTDEFKGQKISRGPDIGTDALSAMYRTLEMLGILANKHDSALAFLKEGVDPVFWKKKALWTSDFEADQYGILAGNSIVSIGMSGRPEVPIFLAGLQDQPLINTVDTSKFRRTFDGSLVDAACFYDIVTQRGYGFIMDAYKNGTGMQYFQEWLQTENGKKWDGWYKSRNAKK